LAVPVIRIVAVVPVKGSLGHVGEHFSSSFIVIRSVNEIGYFICYDLAGSAIG
jgi:hypothetical protein